MRGSESRSRFVGCAIAPEAVVMRDDGVRVVKMNG
jgi:hypothetical protein